MIGLPCPAGRSGPWSGEDLSAGGVRDRTGRNPGC
jgi:hypothetical protein